MPVRLRVVDLGSAVTPAGPASTPAPGPPAFAVQVGAFASRARAESVRDALPVDGDVATITEIEVAGRHASSGCAWVRIADRPAGASPRPSDWRAEVTERSSSSADHPPRPAQEWAACVQSRAGRCRGRPAPSRPRRRRRVVLRAGCGSGCPRTSRSGWSRRCRRPRDRSACPHSA